MVLAGGTYLGGSASAFGPIRAITDAADGRLLKSNCTDRPPARSHARMHMRMGSARIRAFVHKEKRPQGSEARISTSDTGAHARTRTVACLQHRIDRFADLCRVRRRYRRIPDGDCVTHGLCHDA